jgi:hypothetical protein
MSTPVHVLVVAKAPVPGSAKTRLGVTLGDDVAAELAAAALLDTITAAEGAGTPETLMIALSGDLAHAARGDEIAARLATWQVVEQRGTGLAERLVHAHRDAADHWGERGPLVQVGMDTPQVTPTDLLLLAVAAMRGGPAGCGLGPAFDGGWWGLATMTAGYADALAHVPMSSPRTGALTVSALRRTGAEVVRAHRLRDVDTITDAIDVAARFPDLEFSAVFAEAHGDEVA